MGLCLSMIFAWSLRNQIEVGRFKVSLIDEVNLKRYHIPEYRYYTGVSSYVSEAENPYREYFAALIYDPSSLIDLNIYHVYRYLSDLGRGYLYFPKIFDRYSVTNVIPKAGLTGLIKGDLNDSWRSISKVISDRPGLKGTAFACFFLSYSLYLLTLYAFFCVGAFAACRDRSIVILILVSAFSYGAIFSGYVASVRFRFPFTFALIGVSFYGLESLFHRFEIRQTSIKEDA